MIKHPLGIPNISNENQHRLKQAKELLEEWERIRKRDQKELNAVTRKAFNHGLYGKEYNHREHKHD